MVSSTNAIRPANTVPQFVAVSDSSVHASFVVAAADVVLCRAYGRLKLVIEPISEPAQATMR